MTPKQIDETIVAGGPIGVQGGPGTPILNRWLAFAVLSWLASGALYLTLPPSPDQFVHAYAGWRLLAGDVPYRDLIDMNWPGVMALHGLASWIFGVNVWSWRALDFCLFALSALFLSDLVRKVAGLSAGRLNLIICPLIYVGASYWLPGQHDMSAAQFLVAALWCHVRGYERNTWSWQIGAGLLLGAAMLNKPTVGVMGVLFPLQALLAGTPVRSVLAHTAVAGVASVAALLAALGAVLARGAALSDVIDCLYTYNVVSQFLDARPLSEIAYLALFFHFRWWPVVTLGSLPAVFWILRGPPRSIGTTALPMLWICGVLSYFIQWTTHAYHLAPSFLALAAGLAISVTLVATGQVSFASGARGRKFGAGFIALALIGIGFKLVFSYYTLPQALWTGDHREHLSRFEAGDGLSVAETVAFMPRLGAVPSKDCLLMVGTNSALNYLAMRPEPTRFYHFPVLFLTRSPLPMTERWINQWEADLKAAECRFALVGQRWVHRDNWLEGPSRAAGALREFLQGYAQSGVLGANGGMKVYERR